MIVAITGRIGSGKTVVGRFFAEKGANVIEADHLGHEVLENNDIKRKLIKSFGRKIIDKNLSIDRKRLGELAFKSKKTVKILNKITHPLLINKIKNNIRKNGINVIVAALYYELKLDEIKDMTIVVKCNKKTIMNRLKNKKILERQKYIKEVKDSDFTIFNNKTLSETRKQFDEIWRELR
jgi:dephospho-CoA kinase